MKHAGAVVDVLCIVGLTLPGVTIYLRWPDFVFTYAGVAILALVGIGWIMSRGPKDVA